MADQETSAPDDMGTGKPERPEPLTLETPAYTTFSHRQQNAIFVLVTLAALASPMAAILYLPLVPLLAIEYGVSTQAINLTITVYIVLQATAPLLLSTHSDTFGRRPIYLVSFTLFSLASLGLALNRHSYAALVALRALQSIGASAVLSVGYGVIADLRPSETRGTALGTILAFSNLGTAIGPVIGGAAASGPKGLQWAFWTMFSFASGMLVALAVLLPETSRNVVGNGAARDAMWNRPLWTPKSGTVHTTLSSIESGPELRRTLAFKSPLQAIAILRFPDTALVLWIVGSFYAMWYTVQASMPTILTAEPYRLSELHVGLCYLPGAAGVVLCMYTTGKVMDHNYRVVRSRWVAHQDTNDSNTKRVRRRLKTALFRTRYDAAIFPIERARSRFCIPLLLPALAACVGYGWVVHARVHLAAVLVLQFCIGFLCTWILNVFNALLVDMYPDAPSTAATAGNLVRCGFSAAAVAAIDPLTRATNRGWFFTIMGVLSCALGLIAVLCLNRSGTHWRQKRVATIEGS